METDNCKTEQWYKCLHCYEDYEEHEYNKEYSLCMYCDFNRTCSTIHPIIVN